MNIPMSWLKEYVNIDCDLKTFVAKMTMSGSKVEAIERIGAEITNVAVGKVLEIEKHPDADKLVVTKIDIGEENPLQIVTGATNLFVGAVVPVAKNGAVLANDVKIKTGKLRGVVSEGMLCSVEELGYTRNDYPEAPEDGIYIFNYEGSEPREYPLGADACDLLMIREDVVEYELTSNRPDCFSVLGISREAAATFDKPFNYPKIVVAEKGEGNAADMISVEIKNTDLCPRYVARVVQNVKIEPSPLWMRHRLTSAGIRPINNIVDITNYVMLELGQPMHAFDITCIDDRKIIVRNAEDNEKFVTLDGEEHILDSSMLVIADKNKAVAVAGVMGGENSKITGGANAVLFESANFNGTNIRKTSKKLGMRTDSSSKFEKGIDPSLALEAVNRAVQLVELLGCGDVVKGVVDNYPCPRTERTVKYCACGINKLLGTDISEEQMIQYFEKVGIKAANGKAIIPTFRPDIECEADLTEEVARLYGYDNIEATLASGTPTVGKKNYKQMLEDMMKKTLVAQGYSEMLSYAFESPKVFEKLNIPSDDILRNTVKILNPLGEDFSIMRTTTLNSVLSVLATNYNKRNEEAMVFELAKVYIPKSLPLTDLPNENPVLTIGMYGKKDFYDLKGAVESLMESIGITSFDFMPKNDLPYMHPGRTAEVTVDGTYVGYIGEVHPSVTENYDIGAKCYVAVLDTELLTEKSELKNEYKPIPKYPAMKRDIAMIVKDEVLVRDIEKAISERGGKILESVTLFDVYKGDKLQEGHKSVAYSISFRAADRTLTDDEVVSAMKKILANLEEKVGAQLRDK